MPPTVILIRHAQGLHNATDKSPLSPTRSLACPQPTKPYPTDSSLTSPPHLPPPARLLTPPRPQDYTIPDPPLTPRGYAQCAALSTHLQASPQASLSSRIGLIITSPLQRTLQTTSRSLDFLIARGVPVLVRSEWQENSAAPCDTGSAVPLLKDKWPQFDWSGVDPLFPAKSGLYAYSLRAMRERGREARRWLRERPEKVVVVVSYGGFLKGPVSSRRYENGDYRVFEFAEGGEGEEEAEARLVEWELTEARGGGLGKSEKGVWGFEPWDYATDEKYDGV